MAIILYILGLIAVLLVTVGSVCMWHTKPTWKSVISGLAVATLMTFLDICFTCILNPEGNSTHLPLLLWLCVGVVTTLFPSAKAKTLSTVCLFLFASFFCLSIQYFRLATSARYTDNPKWRLRRIANDYKRAQKNGGTPPNVVIRPTLHTWLTGLYSVHVAPGFPLSRSKPQPVTPIAGTKISTPNLPTTIRLSPPPHAEPVMNRFDFEVMKQAASRRQLLAHYGRIYASCTELTLSDSHLLCFAFDVGSGTYIWKGAIYLQKGDTWHLVEKLPVEKKHVTEMPNHMEGGYLFTPVGDTALQIVVSGFEAKHVLPYVLGKQTASIGTGMVYHVVETLSLDTLKARALYFR